MAPQDLSFFSGDIYKTPRAWEQQQNCCSPYKLWYKLVPSPLALLGQDIPLSALSDGRSSSLKTFLFLR